jgi:hypothetical protein
MNTDFLPGLCFGWICLAPILAFALGVYIGRRGLGFRVRIERAPRFVADTGEEKSEV